MLNDREQLIFCAGMIDARAILRGTHLMLYSRSLPQLRLLKRVFGFGTITKMAHRTGWLLQTKGRKTLRILRKTEPYLLQLKAQANSTLAEHLTSGKTRRKR